MKIFSWRRHFLLQLMGALVLVSCDTFRADFHNPHLPEYSEVGAQTGGVIFNGIPYTFYYSFFLQYENIPRYAIYTDTVANYTIFSMLFDRSPSAEGAEAVQLNFHFPNIQIRSLNDLNNLENQSFLLDGNASYFSRGEIISYESFYQDTLLVQDSLIVQADTCLAGVGKIEFNFLSDYYQANNLESSRVLAGTFGFQSNDICGNIEAKYGRFDVILTQNHIREF